MYTEINFKNKAELKRAVARGDRIRVFQPNDMFNSPTANRSVSLEGPHYPEPHKWYAMARTDCESCIIPGTVK